MRDRGRPRGMAREAARSALFATARRIVIQEGWTALKLARIGKESGYNAALVGYYFGTMGNLREELRASGVVTLVPHVCRCEVCKRELEGGNYHEPNPTAPA